MTEHTGPTGYSGAEHEEELMLFALDLLPSAEEARVAARLEGLPEARQVVEQWHQILAETVALDEAEPPDSLRSRMLSALPQQSGEGSGAQVSQLFPADQVGDGVATQSAATQRATAGSSRATRSGARPGRRQVLGGLLAAAGLAGVATMYGVLRDPELTPEQEVMRAQDVTHDSTSLSTGELMVMRSESQGRSVAVADDVPAPPSGRVYQAWVVKAEGSAEPAGVLQEQDGQLVTLLPTDLPSGASVAVTEEPTGGSEQPTTEPMGVLSL